MRLAERGSKSVVFSCHKGPHGFCHRVRGGGLHWFWLMSTTALFVYMTHSAVVSRFETSLPLRTREKGWDVSDPPKNRGVMRPFVAVGCYITSTRPHDGSLTSSFNPCGKAQKQPPGAALKAPLLPIPSTAAPLPLALHCVESVLAVKGPLRRFAPWTATGRSGEKRCSRWKGGNCGQGVHTRTGCACTL